MSKEIDEITEIFQRLLDYFYTGALAFIVLDTLRTQVGLTKKGGDSYFIVAVYLASYNTLMLALANTAKPDDDSINLHYLFNCIRASRRSFSDEQYDQLAAFLLEFESALLEIEGTIEAAVKIRNTTVAHLDRKHVNNPAALSIDSPANWDNLKHAYNIVGNGLLKIGKIFGLSHIENYTTLANYLLARETKDVFEFITQT